MAFENVTTALPALAIEHDNRHRLRPAPHSREGVVFMLSLPEEGLAGFIYPWINGNGTANAATCIFGPGVSAPIQERFEDVAVSEDMDFYDWSVGGLRLKIDEPMVSADVSFHGEKVQLDYRFDGMHPAYAFGSHKDGCPQYYADDRMEQHGHVKGVLRVEGRSIPFETVGQRDHAWGTRIWGLNQHYKWFHATTQTSAVHFFEMQSFGAVHVRGFVFKDGVMSQVASVAHEYVFDDDMHHISIDVVVVDDLQRVTRVECETFAKYQFNADPKIVLKESATIVKVDGVGGVGWCEFCWNKDYYDLARIHAEEFQPYK
ncbi:DUF7064 domain-containing protein [Sphingomonas sp. ID0503]|uniref:DUF7064 domain-containing protein n=1 Tax=Sphingomonas sp. ID0503 TaxID=3399691 RepID=UPI003AFAF4EF